MNPGQEVDENAPDPEPVSEPTPPEFSGYATKEGLMTGDFREKKVPFQLKTVVLVLDPINSTGTWAEYIRPLLDALNTLPGLVRGEAFNMTLDAPDFNRNQQRLTLEFETE